MDGSDTPCPAHVVPRDTFDEALSCLARARQAASRRTLAAQVTIAEREVALNSRITAFEAELAAAEQSRYTDLIDEQAIRARANEAALILQDAARFQAAVDDAAPMLAELVATCLERIIGTLAPEDVLAAIVAEAMGELRAKGRLRLLVAPSNHAAISAIVADKPERFAGVAEVTPDADLAPGTMHLDGDGGFADISLSAQIDACCEVLALADPAQDPQS